MTKLTKSVSRESGATILSSGKDRPIIATLEPPCILALRLKGTRKIYRLALDGLFLLTVQRDTER